MPAANNHRDAAHDARVGRRTFAVVFGPRASAGLHATPVVRTVSLALRYALLMAAGAVLGRIVA